MIKKENGTQTRTQTANVLIHIKKILPVALRLAGFYVHLVKYKHISLFMWVYKCSGASEEKEGKGKWKKEGKERGLVTPSYPIPFRLCCDFPTDLCHLAVDLNFGASSVWNAPTRGSTEGKMKMK